MQFQKTKMKDEILIFYHFKNQIGPNLNFSPKKHSDLVL